jgi:hypothetical protein
MFVYPSLDQVRHQDFRGPDFFVVLGVPKRERKSWVVWQEGKGPTAAQDKGEKKAIYQDRLRVPEYFWFDPCSGEWAGFVLRNEGYAALAADGQRRLVSQKLALALVRWQGFYQEIEARWLRWATLNGALLQTPQEVAVAAQRQVADAQRQAIEAQQHAATLEARLARYRQRFGDLPE